MVAKKKATKKTTKKKTTKKKTSTKPSKPTETVDDLLRQLEATDDQNEKKKIRAKLRSRGHKGGARQTDRAKAATKKAANKKKTAKKKTTKKKASPKK